MKLAQGLRMLTVGRRKAITAAGLIAAGMPGEGVTFSTEEARKLSAVDRCLEILSDSIAKLPNYVIDSKSRRRLADHPALYALNVRPNEAFAKRRWSFPGWKAAQDMIGLSGTLPLAGCGS